MLRTFVTGLVTSALLALPCGAMARGGNALRLMGAFGFGSVEDAGYGATGILSGGIEVDDVFSIELQGGVGITEEVGLGPERFFHIELLVPATMTICAYDSWICPSSVFELVLISGIGGARFTGRWSPNVIAGAALDSLRLVESLEIGVRAAVVGSYDVIDYERLVVMMQLYLGIIFRFGGN